MNVLFVCIGAAVSGHAAEPVVVQALREVGIDASDHVPRQLDDEALAWADLAVTVCRDDVCPATPGVRQIHWRLDDPWGRPIEEVRVIRDGILERVEQLASELQ